MVLGAKDMVWVILFTLITYTVIVGVATVVTIGLDWMEDGDEVEIATPDDEFMAHMSSIAWSHPYERGDFDCSNMAVEMDGYVERYGYEAQICTREQNGTVEGHAWIRVNVSGTWYDYECTTLEWRGYTMHAEDMYDNVTEIHDEYITEGWTEKDFAQEWR